MNGALLNSTQTKPHQIMKLESILEKIANEANDVKAFLKCSHSDAVLHVANDLRTSNKPMALDVIAEMTIDQKNEIIESHFDGDSKTESLEIARRFVINYISK